MHRLYFVFISDIYRNILVVLLHERRELTIDWMSTDIRRKYIWIFFLNTIYFHDILSPSKRTTI